MGINTFKFVIWEVNRRFYGRKFRFTATRQISDFPPQMTNLNAFISILMHLFIFSIDKMYYLHKATSAVSCVKSNASQWEATLRDDVGFSTVYRRIYMYRRKCLTLSNQTSRYIRKCIRIRVHMACSNHAFLEWLEATPLFWLNTTWFNHFIPFNVQYEK